MKHFYTVATKTSDNGDVGMIRVPDITVTARAVLVQSEHEALVLVAPGLVAVDGIYHGEDTRTSPRHPLLADIREKLIAEAKRLGTRRFNPDRYWLQG